MSAKHMNRLLHCSTKSKKSIFSQQVIQCYHKTCFLFVMTKQTIKSPRITQKMAFQIVKSFFSKVILSFSILSISSNLQLGYERQTHL